MKNQKLTQAKINAYDEFYTQRKTIEKELKYYIIIYVMPVWRNGRRDRLKSRRG